MISRKFQARLNPFAAALLPLTLPGLALAGPSGADVVAGDIDIHKPDPATTVVDQASQGAIINWQQFSIDGNEYVVFNQPSASAAVLNRVIGGNPSEILGQLSSNGRVFLVNPSGVVFGRGAQLDVGGLVATTMDISDKDFLDGRYVFTGNGSTAQVRNEGSIRAGDRGFVVLSGDAVRNSGTIEAAHGDVLLAAGSRLTLNLDGTGLVSYSIDAAAVSEQAGVTNLGEILAQGGSVVMAADVARNLASTAVNNQGLVRATGIGEDGGEIYLTASGGDVLQQGTLDVSAQRGHDAGAVDIASDRSIELAAGSTIVATGDGGGTVRAVAGHTLRYAQGARIDVARQSSGGSGGFVELSGHEDVFVRDLVSVGSQGQVLIDPAHFVVGSGAEDNITQALLEAQLESMSEDSQYLIEASDSILFRALAGGLLDARTAATSTDQQGNTVQLGGGLSLAITGAAGSISFENRADTLLLDGDLTADAGSEGGSIALGNLAARSIYLDAIDGVTTGALTAAGNIDVNALRGGLDLGDIGSGGVVRLGAGDGLVQAGDVEAVAGFTAESSNQDLSDDSPDGSGGFDGPVSGILLGDVSVSEGYVYLYTSQPSSDLPSGYGISAGDVRAYSGISAFANDAGISLGALSVGSGAQAPDFADLYLSADHGRIATGAIDVRGVVDAGASIYSYHEDGVRIDGSVRIETSGGGSLGGEQGTPEASLYVYSPGEVEVTGDIDLVSRPSAYESYGGDSYYGGDAYLDIDAASIVIGGATAVEGTGEARVYLNARRSIRTGDISALAHAAQSTSVFGETGESFSQNGVATVELYTEAYYAEGSDTDTSEIRTGDLSATGPNAGVAAQSGRLIIGDADAGNAITVHAVAGGLDSGGVYGRVSEDGEVLLTTTAGIGVLSLAARGGSASDPAIVTTGGIGVRGPQALALIATGGNIVVGGGLSVQGTGYDTAGDWDYLYNLDYGYYYHGSMFGAPVLSEGSLHWGSAGLLISSYSDYGGYGDLAAVDPALSAGDILIQGDLDVAGIGSAYAQIYAHSLDLDLGDGLRGDFTVDAVSGGAGRILGRYESYEYIDETTAFYTTHEIDDGAGGAARYGLASAQVLLSGSGARLETGDFSIRGLSAQAAIMGDGAVADLGDVTVMGASGADAPVVRDSKTYVAESGDPPPGSTTLIVGDRNGLDVDLGSGSAFQAASVTIGGRGFSTLDVSASDIAVSGVVTLDASRGQFTSDDTLAYGESFDEALGDVGLRLGSADAPARVGGLSVTADGNVHLDLNLDAAGNVLIEAGGVLSQLAPAYFEAYAHPLSLGYPGLAPGVESAAAEAAAGAPQIAADGDVTLRIGADSTLDGLAVNAGGLLTLDGNGHQLSASGFALSGGSLLLQDLDLAAESVQLGATGSAADALRLQAAVVNAASLALDSAGGLSLLDSSLATSGDLALSADGNLELLGSTLEAASLDARSGGALTLGANGERIVRIDVGSGLVSLQSQAAMRVSGTQLTAAGLDLGAGGDLELAGNTLALQSASFDAGGALRFSGALAVDSLSLSGAQGVTLASAQIEAQTVDLDAGGAVALQSSSIGADALSLRGGAVSIADTDVNADSIGIEAASLEIRDGSQLHAGAAFTASAGGTFSVTGSSLSATAFDWSSGGDTLLRSSTLNGNLQLAAGGVLTLEGAQLGGGSGQLVSTGNLVVQNLGTVRSRLSYSQSLNLQSTGGALSVIASDLEAGQGTAGLAKATGPGSINLLAAGPLLLRDASLQGAGITVDGSAIALESSHIAGSGAVQLIARSGSVDDNGTAGSIEAGGLGVQAKTLIDLLQTSLDVGTGAAGIGGDAALIEALAQHGLQPRAATPNAAFIAEQSVALGAIRVTGDYFFVKADRIGLGQAQVVDDVLLQLQPFTSSFSIGLEEQLAALRDLNLAIQGQPGRHNTFVIGGSGYQGAVYVGETGALDSLDTNNVVIYTSGQVFAPSRLVTSTGQVVVVGQVVEPPPPPEERPVDDEIGAIQNQIVNTGAPQVALGRLQDDDDRIDLQTGADTTLICQ